MSEQIIEKTTAASEEKKYSLARRVTGDIFVLFFAAFTVYLSVIMINRINSVVQSSIYTRMFIKELDLCAVLLIASLDLRFGFFTKLRPKTLKTLGWVLRAVFAVLAVAVLAVFGKVLISATVNNAGSENNVIVLGMALENGQPTKDLLGRVETAKTYAEEHPDAVLILTGGNPDEQGRTEAAVMRDLLIEKGFPEERIILEDKARDTKGNFKNTAELVDPDSPVIIVSSDYHMGRAVKTAKEAGFTNIKRLPAPSDPVMFGANVMWEVTSEVSQYTRGSAKRPPMPVSDSDTSKVNNK